MKAEEEEKRKLTERQKAIEILGLLNGFTPGAIQRICNNVTYITDNKCSIVIPENITPDDLK